jgi:hypothetical protein
MANTPHGPLASLHVPDLARVLAGPCSSVNRGKRSVAIADHPRADDR